MTTMGEDASSISFTLYMTDSVTLGVILEVVVQVGVHLLVCRAGSWWVVG